VAHALTRPHPDRDLAATQIGRRLKRRFFTDDDFAQ
jgi:hypothetical protein